MFPAHPTGPPSDPYIASKAEGMAYDRLPQHVQQLCESETPPCGGWSFLSPSDINRRGQYRQHMIPIATQYGGLGLFHVLEYVPSQEAYFVHIDGGSNDYDRQDHAVRWNAYNPKPDEIVEASTVDFDPLRINQTLGFE